MSNPALIALILVLVAVVVLAIQLKRFVRRETVYDWETGLLYRDGKFERELPPGSLLLFGQRQRVIRIGNREMMNVVPGQDVLSRDNVTVKISLITMSTVTDPVKLVQSIETGEEASGRQHHLHGLAQLALRRAVAAIDLEDLLADREAVGARMTEGLTAAFADIGVALREVAIRDIMLAGQVRSAYAAKTLAALEGQAALERARGESAALRSLANAARMLKDNPDLFQLRLVQAVEHAEGTPNIVVDLAGRAGAPDSAGRHDKKD